MGQHDLHARGVFAHSDCTFATSYLVTPCSCSGEHELLFAPAIEQVSDTGLYSTRHYYEVAVTGPYTEDKWYRWIPDVAWGCVLITLVVVEVKSIVRHASNPAKLGLCRKPRDAEGRVIGSVVAIFTEFSRQASSPFTF